MALPTVGFTIRPRIQSVMDPDGVMVIVSDQVADYFDYVAPSILRDLRSKMRVGLSGEQREGIDVKVTRGPKQSSLSMRPTTVQGAIDEVGLEPGKAFPPYGFGTTLYAWVYAHFTTAIERGSKRVDSFTGSNFAEWLDPTKHISTFHGDRTESFSFLVARAINKRGQPAPMFMLGRPFFNTREDWREEIEAGLKATLWKAALIINGGNARL